MDNNEGIKFFKGMPFNYIKFILQINIYSNWF